MYSTVACTVRRNSTWSTVVNMQSPTSLLGTFQIRQSTTLVLSRHQLQIYGQWIFSVTVTHCRTIWEIRALTETAFVDYWLKTHLFTLYRLHSLIITVLLSSSSSSLMIVSCLSYSFVWCCLLTVLAILYCIHIDIDNFIIFLVFFFFNCKMLRFVGYQ